jgi:two-component system, NtrC family, nitrogen regulation sensor histidine kinase NtrY
MDFSRRFAVRLALRSAVLVAAVGALAWLATRASLPATTLLAVGLVVWAAAGVWSLVRSTNVELERFVSALNHGDLAQSFTRIGRGSGFEELGDALDGAMRRLRDERAASAAENRFASALVDGAPTPLLAIDGEGRIELSNKAARRLFDRVDGVRAADFASYGTEFVDALEGVLPGSRRLSPMLVNGLSQRAMLAATTVERGGAVWRIVSVQIIQRELNAAEIAVQTDLVRVLTHEIMNSMTPVTSLAASAAQIMAEIDDGQDEAVGDARLAVETLARRAEGIMHFVETYRSFSRAPEVVRRPFAAIPWADQLVRLFGATPQAAGVALDLAVADDLDLIDGDADLLTQVVLNLMKNGAEAAAGHADTPRLGLSIAPLQAGRVRIAVSDNGPGVAANLAEDVFLPFFTTKRDGTGVGLSFARQVVLLHEGAITLGKSETGGARFEIVI